VRINFMRALTGTPGPCTCVLEGAGTVVDEHNLACHFLREEKSAMLKWREPEFMDGVRDRPTTASEES
jgi:hypothetical protein